MFIGLGNAPQKIIIWKLATPELTRQQPMYYILYSEYHHYIVLYKNTYQFQHAIPRDQVRTMALPGGHPLLGSSSK